MQAKCVDVGNKRAARLNFAVSQLVSVRVSLVTFPNIYQELKNQFIIPGMPPCRYTASSQRELLMKPKQRTE